MNDLIEKIHGSLIQHGPENDRVYLMKLDCKNVKETLDYVKSLFHKENYTKVLVKIPADQKEPFLKEGFVEDAIVPGFYKGTKDGVFLGKYSICRREMKQKSKVFDVIKTAENKPYEAPQTALQEGFEFSILDKTDIPKITSLYKKVFKTYPFPIFNEEYIEETMDTNITYFGIKKDGEPISISSAEKDHENLNCEMTDFATHPDFRGNSFALFLLNKMEDYLKEHNYQTAYTIARSVSYAMNITFSKNGYTFAGTLVNNSNISGDIENMNVWYKSLL